LESLGNSSFLKREHSKLSSSASSSETSHYLEGEGLTQIGEGSMIFIQGRKGEGGTQIYICILRSFVIQRLVGRNTSTRTCFTKGGSGDLEHGFPPFAPALSPL